MNYITLLVVLIFTTNLNSSLPAVVYVQSESGASTEYSFVQRYTPQDNAKKDPVNEVHLLGEKEELIRLWIESTSIFRMNN